MDELIKKVERWAEVRKLDTADPKAQALKVIEEFTEMIIAREQNDTTEVIDGIGDSYVTVINLDKQLGLDVREIIGYKSETLKDLEGRGLAYEEVRELSIGGKVFVVRLISGLSSAISKGNKEGIIDELMYILFAAELLADEYSTTPEHCLQEVYNEIKDRKGMMIDGTFVKYEDLSDENKAVLDNA